MGGTPGAPPPGLGHCPRDIINLKNAPTLGHSQAPPLGHCPRDVIRPPKNWKTPPPPLDIARVTSSTYSKGGTKLLKGGTKLLKGWNKIFGMGNWGGSSDPPPPPLATGLHHACSGGSGGGGTGVIPPPRTCPDPENLCRVCVTGADRGRSPPPPLGMWMTSHGQCLRGVLVNVQEWRCFPIFRRADDVSRTMFKTKGGACECSQVMAEGDDVTRAMSKECIHPPPFQEILYLRLYTIYIHALAGIVNIYNVRP